MAIRINIGANVDAKAVTDSLNNLLNQWETTTDRMKRSINEALGGKTEKVVEIQYQVDDSGLKKAVAVERERYTVLDDIKKQYEKESRVEQGSLTNLRQRLNTATQLRDQVNKYVRDAENGVISGVRINEQWTKANENVQQLRSALQAASNSSFFDRIQGAFDDAGITRFFKGLQNTVQAFQALAIIVQTVSASFDVFTTAQKKIQGLDLTFRSIGQGVEGGAQALASAADISQDLGVSLDTTINGFRQLSPVILNAGGSMQDVADITESLSSRFVAFGKSADESKRILNAVIQAFGKGKLQAEELNQQISEADPAFRTDLASAIGVTTSQLEEMVKKGKVTSEMLIDILPKMNKLSEIFKLGGLSATEAARSLGMVDEYGRKVGPTLEQVTNKIGTINQLTLIKVADEFDGLIQAVYVIQAAFADFFSQVADSTAFSALATVVSDLALGFANVTSVVLEATAFFIDLLSPVGETIKALSDMEILGIRLGEVFGTIVAIGLTIWFVKWTAASIAGTIALMKQGVEIAKNILGRKAETAETIASTIATKANTVALLENAGARGLAAGGGVNALGGAAKGLAGAGSDISKLIGPAGQAGKTLSNLNEIVPVTVKVLGEAGSAANTASGGMKLLPPAANSVAGAMKALPPATSAWTKALEYLKGIGSSIAGFFSGGFTSALNSIGNFLKGGLTSATNLGGKALQGLGNAAKALGPLFTVAVNGIKAFGAGVAAFLVSPAGIALTVLASLGLAIAAWKTATSGADAANKQYGAGITDLNKVIEANKTKNEEAAAATEKHKSAWDSSVASVGLLGAAYDVAARATNGINAALGKTTLGVKAVTIESIQNTQTLLGSTEAYGKFQDKLSQVEGILKSQLSTMGQDTAKKEEAKSTLGAYTKAIEQQVAAEKKNLTILQQKVPANAEEKAQVDQLINLTKQRITTMENMSKARQKEAKDAGMVTQATLTEIDAAKQALEVQKLRQEYIEQKNNAAIEDLKGKWEEEKKAIESAQDAAQSYFETLKRGNEDAKTSEDRRHNAVKNGLENEKNAIQERYDAEKEALDELKTQIEATYDAKLQRLKDPTASEAALKELEIAELQRQAAQGRTNEEKLRAKAQLERIEADKKAADLEKQKKAELAVVEAQQKAAEKQKELELAEIKKREREEDRAHAARMEALADEAVALQRAAADSAKKAKEDEQKLAEQYGPIIKQAEQEIQAEKAKTEAAQQRVNALQKGAKEQTDAATGAQKAHTTAIGESADAIRNKLIRNLDEYANKIRNLPKIPTAPQTNFAGGHVGPGLVGTVNELGKEAFLSDSGKLSWINKPAWSKWVAPSSGTIIPAHIAAGLDIPSGGTSINNSTVRSVSRTTNSNMNYRSMAKLLGAALGSNAGTVNNSVVINSDRPAKTASDMLVEMTKIRRNRYS